MTHKKSFGIGMAVLILFLSIMSFTTPTQQEFDKWIMKEHQIQCDNEGEGTCTKGQREVWLSSFHLKNMAVIASYENVYIFENGEERTYRTIGIGGQFFSVKEGALWGVLN